MDIEIKKAGEIDGKEYGIDQYKNIYERYVNTTAWFEIFEYRKKPGTKNPSCEEIKIIKEKNFFYWSVDNNGDYWKRYKQYRWKKIEYEDKPKYGLSTSIIASRGQSYWTLEPNGTVIRRDNDVPLNQVKKRMFDVNFYKTMYRTACKHCGKVHKRKTTKK